MVHCKNLNTLVNKVTLDSKTCKCFYIICNVIVKYCRKVLRFDMQKKNYILAVQEDCYNINIVA